MHYLRDCIVYSDLSPQVIMTSVGFKSAAEISCKCIAVFQLSNQLLSPQQHYDWGLRAIKTVLSSAGNLLQVG